MSLLVVALAWPGQAQAADGGGLASASARPSTFSPRMLPLDGMAAEEGSRPAGLPPLALYFSEVEFRQLRGGTTVVPASLYSPALDREMPYEVILPPDYEASEQSYPVLYLLHGYAGWSHSWVELRMAETADYFWSRPAGQGKLDHFIIVLPEGENSYFLNHADDGARWGDYLVEDVVQHVDATYRTRADARYRAIGGLSMGADGALQLALNHPQVFSIAGAHSPTTRLSYDLAPGDFYGEEAYWQEHNPLWLVANTERAQQLKIWIDSGSEDDWLPNAQALHEALEAQGIEHHYQESAGGHTAEYWIGSSPAYLRFYAQAFAEVTTLVEAELEPAESDQTEL